MLKWLIEKLIARAQRTPYFHLDGYMNRWWLVPYNVAIKRVVTLPPIVVGGRPETVVEYLDGTGPVGFRRRPFTWLIQKCGIAIRVHEILRSDLGRDPHNHPWAYLTIILRGRYVEERFDDKGNLIATESYGPGSILYRPANSWHKLYLYGGPVTTLFFTGKKVQRWGFLSPEGEFTPYDKYLGRNN